MNLEAEFAYAKAKLYNQIDGCPFKKDEAIVISARGRHLFVNDTHLPSLRVGLFRLTEGQSLIIEVHAGSPHRHFKVYRDAVVAESVI